MNHTNTSNGWRWLGLAVLLAILLLLWLAGYGPTLAGMDSGCCGVAATAQTPATPPMPVGAKEINLGLKDDNGKVTLTGTVPSEQDHQNILTQANGVYGNGNFIDQITVSTNAALPKWWQNFGRALSWLKANPNIGLSQLGETITLTGAVPGEAIKSAKENEARAMFAGTTAINNLITLAAPPSVANAAPETLPCSKDMNIVISFATNSAVLSDEGKKQLEQVAKCIALPTEVVGHTDSDGNDSYNKKLSKARANAAIAYINSIDKTKGKLLTATGHGESNPIADNSSEEGKAQNRRIEFVAK